MNAELDRKAVKAVEAMVEIIDIIQNSWLSPAGRYRQIEEIVERMVKEDA